LNNDDKEKTVENRKKIYQKKTEEKTAKQDNVNFSYCLIKNMSIGKIRRNSLKKNRTIFQLLIIISQTFYTQYVFVNINFVRNIIL